ncbi:FAD-binding protein [Chondromyces apiculatus]|uniref:FAD/FMN-containing dehydrogenase n=1 Tax=Chondromyces apiculatus DSM 436 TaxID=1192034 RepID=A0A017T994_9BACT|nr:FAD-binding oxidoreductase [Chondromyces apiculatus]EYF05166.1 FAD/FMN-containing dehydrogenase [Chondromyces apiculatus DSM 436]
MGSLAGDGVAPLRTKAPWRVLDGFGRAVHAACRYAAPRSVEELEEVLGQAWDEGLSVAFRGSGRSYGDAALNTEGIVVDATGLDRVVRWEPETGVFEAEPGVTIEGLWRRTIEDGFWPAVVPGTMKPTLGGCVSMNIHGKNNFRAGTFGEHVLELDLLTPGRGKLRCSREENPEIFHAVVGGLGLLGAVTRVKLQLKRVESGRLRVRSLSAWSLDEMFDQFEGCLPGSDYVVGWVDCFARGEALGRGQIHAASYLEAGEDPEGRDSLHVEAQGLPGHILGVPKSKLWRLMKPFTNDFWVSVVNGLKFRASTWEHGKSYLQSHVGFAFLLDYVPDWRLAYGAGGFIQVQVFVPHEGARACLHDVLAMCQEAGLPSYLGVLKRHRPDAFLLSHAVDGWSLALDFRVTAQTRARLWALTEQLTERVLAAGGRFYFAKDAVLRPEDVTRAYGRERLEGFLALKAALDPRQVLRSDLLRRALPPGPIG